MRITNKTNQGIQLQLKEDKQDKLTNENLDSSQTNETL
jgi:hypothetical protein